MIGTEGAKPEKVLRLAAMRPGGIHVVRELSRAEAEAYLAAQEHLKNHHKAASLIEIVRRNFSAFRESTGELSRQVPQRGKHGELQREAEIEVNRHFLNFLAALRQFLDHTETRLKRQYEHAPEVVQAFKARASKSFDTVFAYRFLYKLRNYSQHCGPPVGFVDFESKAIGRTGLVEHRLHLLFDAAQLLSHAEDVWGSVKKDLVKLKGRFPVEPLPEQAMAELEAVWSVVREAERPHLVRSATIAVDTVQDVPPPYTTPAVLRFWHRKESTTIEILNPPVDTMQWLGHHVFRAVL